jgi:hypothetical protein
MVALLALLRSSVFAISTPALRTVSSQAGALGALALPLVAAAFSLILAL